MKDELAKRLGYISKEEHAETLQRIEREYERKIRNERASNDAYRNRDISKITEAIRGTRMVQARVSDRWVDITSNDLEMPEAAHVETINPVRPEYVTLSAKIDIAGMRRINNDLERYPMELEYFVGNFMHELQDRIKTAMSMSGIF